MYWQLATLAVLGGLDYRKTQRVYFRGPDTMYLLHPFLWAVVVSDPLVRDTCRVFEETPIRHLQVVKGTQAEELLKEERLFNPLKSGHCPDCGEAFKKRRELLVHHRRAHSGLRPYRCVRCELSFFRTCDLIAHLRSHLGEWCCKKFCLCRLGVAIRMATLCFFEWLS